MNNFYTTEEDYLIALGLLFGTVLDISSLIGFNDEQWEALKPSLDYVNEVLGKDLGNVQEILNTKRLLN